MKKILFFLSTLLVCISTYADKVKFKITGIAPKEITELEVRNLNNDDIGGTIIAVIPVKDGHFTYKGTQPDNTFLQFRTKSGRWNVVVTDGEDITLDMIHDTASGSPLTEKLFAEAHKIGAKGNGFEPARLEQIYKAVEENKDNCLPAYFIGYNLDYLTYEKLVEFEHSGDAYTKCPMFQMTRARIAKLKPTYDLVGTKFKDFSAKNGSGEKHKLSEYVGHGKYVLVSLWGRRFALSAQDIPLFKECYNKYKSEGFDIVSIAFENTRTDWLTGVSQFNMAWTQLYEDLPDRSKLIEDVRKKYGKSIVIPWNFLCDPEGTIIAVSMKPQELKNKLAEVFGK